MPRKWNKIPTHNFCRLKKKKKSDLYSAQELWVFFPDLWITCGCLAAEPILSPLQTAGIISILTTLISGLLVGRLFFSMSSFPNSSFSHQSPKHHRHTVLAEQWWTSSNLLSQLCLLSLSSSKGGGKDTKPLWPGPVLMSSLFILFSTSNFRFPKVFLLSRVNITNRASL